MEVDGGLHQQDSSLPKALYQLPLWGGCVKTREVAGWAFPFGTPQAILGTSKKWRGEVFRDSQQGLVEVFHSLTCCL